MRKLCGFLAVLILFTSIGIATPQTVEAKSSSTYYIKVNRTMNTVTVYKKDSSGNYTVPVKAMACSVGLSGKTPTGTFTLSGQYRWHELMGGVYGQYCSRITGGVLFHSVYYHTTDPSTLYYNAYNQLGSAASHGCVRLNVADAKWIYDNCGSGTKVTIYDSKTAGPLGKPSTIKISTSSAYRGWDPTDPNTSNPWRKLKPTISGAKSQTVELLSSVSVKKGVTAKDYKGKKVKVTVSGKVNTKKEGKYKIKYTATDSIGNTTTKTVTFTVKDTTKPVIKATEKELTFTEALSEEDLIAALKANFTATDRGTTLSSKYITISAKLLTKAMNGIAYKDNDTYLVKAYATDKAGNVSKTISIKVHYENPNKTDDGSTGDDSTGSDNTGSDNTGSDDTSGDNTGSDNTGNDSTVEQPDSSNNTTQDSTQDSTQTN